MREQDQWTVDLRDRYSLYDKLNRQQLTLEERNIFQMTKFFYRQSNDWGQWTLGRTSVIDAGGVYVDGLVLDVPLGQAWQLGALAGANPKRSTQTFVEGNSDSTIGGLYLTFQPNHLAWGKNLYIAHGLVSERFQGEEDRRFLSQSIQYQWSQYSQLIETAYVDFVPRANLQTGTFTWLQQWSDLLDTRLQALGVDVIEYARRQGLREQLTPSPYREGEIVIGLGARKALSFDIGLRNGRRLSDDLMLNDQYVRLRTTQEFLPRQLYELRAGQKKNFNSQDNYLQASMSFYNKRWEIVFDLEKSREEYFNSMTLNGTVANANFIFLWSKKMYVSSELQYAGDERLNIYSTFLRLNYRFGSDDLPPLREGAPPGSRL